MDSLASKLTIRDIKDALRSLPSTVDNTYAETMARINSQSEERVSLAQKVLSWVTCAMRPLSLMELGCTLQSGLEMLNLMRMALQKLMLYYQHAVDWLLWTGRAI